MKMHAERGQTAKAFEYMSPSGQKTLAFTLVGMIDMVNAMKGLALAADDSDRSAAETVSKIRKMEHHEKTSRSSLAATLEHHGIDYYEYDERWPGMQAGREEMARIAQEVMAQGKELPQLIESLLASLEEEAEGEGPGLLALLPSGELTDLSIVGDQATATVGNTEVHFVRLGASWYFEG